MEFVRPVDAQGVVIGWLAEQLPKLGENAPVDSFYLSPTPTRFVRVVRTGGSEYGRVVDSSTLEIECYVRGSDDSAAFSLASACRAALHALDGEKSGGSFCFGVGTASGPANLPNPDVPTHQRVRQAFTVDLRMSVIDI